MLATALFVVVLAVNQSIQYKLDSGHAETSADSGTSRIISGWVAMAGQHPHQAVIRTVSRQGQIKRCAAVVVHREWLLTVAHCTAKRVLIVVLVGLNHITKPEMMIESSEYYVYPTFNQLTPDSAQFNDISMIKLPIRLQYSRNLRPIRIQPSSEAHASYDNAIMYASGFGRTTTQDTTAPDTLQWVYLRGVSNEYCVSQIGAHIISDNSICARWYNVTTQSICHGDNGGPLVYVSTDGDPILVGVSTSVVDAGCETGAPGVFTRTGPFHSWFTSVSGLDFENLQEEKENDSTSTSLPSPYISSTLFTTDYTYSLVSDATETSSFDSTISPATASSPFITTSPPIIQTSTSSSNNDDQPHDQYSESLKQLEVNVNVKFKYVKNEKKTNNLRNLS